MYQSIMLTFWNNHTPWCIGDVSRNRVMMMSSNGNIFRVTVHLCREFTGHQWIPHTKTSDTELWFFYMRLNKRSSKQLCDWCSETPSRSLWRHCNIMILRVLNASNLFDLSSFLTAVGLEGSLIWILPEKNVNYIDAAFGLTIRRSLILNVTVHSSGATATGSLAKMV